MAEFSVLCRKLIDSIAQKSSLVAIDPLNNIYGIESQLGYFFRIDQNKKITKQYIKRFANQISYIIKNDPLKIAYVIPSESKVVSIDPNFQKLSTYNDPYSDPLFSFCLYRDGSQCYFINYSLKLLKEFQTVYRVNRATWREITMNCIISQYMTRN